MDGSAYGLKIEKAELKDIQGFETTNFSQASIDEANLKFQGVQETGFKRREDQGEVVITKMKSILESKKETAPNPEEGEKEHTGLFNEEGDEHIEYELEPMSQAEQEHFNMIQEMRRDEFIQNHSDNKK